MVMVLEKNKVCPYSSKCPYNIGGGGEFGKCYGSKKGRDTEFFCEFVVNGKIIKDAGVRLPQDKTGKMKILTE
ncbi:MAG: hypothetical protein ACFFG0_01545 [Candidatus Thorarchaeota archaeon]